MAKEVLEAMLGGDARGVADIAGEARMCPAGPCATCTCFAERRLLVPLCGNNS
jgi:hypothetical protein